jgi:RimJ/RimL family protein N-acetyltransferase
MPLTLGPTLRFETPDFIYRSIVPGDESVEWGSWLADPRNAAMLNTPARARTLDELRKYIATFNRRDRHLFGIFERTTGRHIGIRTVDIDNARRAFSVHMLVGDSDSWGQGSMDQTTGPQNNWLYETLDLLWSEASVLAINKKMIRYLTDNGWTITARQSAVPALNGTAVDLVFLRRHRDVWRKDERSSFVTGIPAPTGLETPAS